MEKISSRDAVASRLKQKEEEISKRIEALQGEMTSTGSDVKNYLKKNPWVGLAGSIVAGIAVGLIAGKKSAKTRQKELVDTYIERLTEVARETGASEREVGALLREALRESAPPAAFAEQKSKSSGLTGKLFGIGLEMAMGFAKKSFLNFLDEKAAAAGSEIEKKDDSQN
ncbi:MAG: hypothetical protein AB8G77_14280 [Rhodothermales bacterium]